MRESWSAGEGSGTKRVHLYELTKKIWDPAPLSAHRGEWKHFRAALWLFMVPNLGTFFPFHGDEEEEGSAGFKGDANGI